MQRDVSKLLSALVAAPVSLDVRKNRCREKLCVVAQPGKQYKKIMNGGRGPNYGNQARFVLNFH
jgi:hypothetical protein